MKKKTSKKGKKSKRQMKAMFAAMEKTGTLWPKGEYSGKRTKRR